MGWIALIVVLLSLLGDVLSSGCHIIQGVVNGEILPHPTPQVKYTYNSSSKRIIIDVIVPYDPNAAVVIDFAPFSRTRQRFDEFTVCENRSSDAFPSGWKLEEFLGTIADTNNFGEKVNPLYPQTGGAGMWRRRVIDCATVAYTLDGYLFDVLRACGGKIISEEGDKKGMTELTLFVTYATPINDEYVNGVSVFSMPLKDMDTSTPGQDTQPELDPEETIEEGAAEETTQPPGEAEEAEEEIDWEFPKEPEPFEEEGDQGGFHPGNPSKPFDKEKYGFFATTTSAFSVFIGEKMAVTESSANTKLGTTKISGARIALGTEKTKYKSALFLDVTTTGTTQVSICDPKIKSSPSLPSDIEVRTVGGSCTCENAKPSSTSTLHNLILSTSSYLAAGVTSGEYTIEVTEVTCAAGSTPKILKTNGAALKFTIDSKITSSDIQHSGVQYSQQSIYAAEGWGNSTFDGYKTSIQFTKPEDDQGDAGSEEESGSGGEVPTDPPTQTADTSTILLTPYVSLFASHPIGTPFYGNVSANPIRLLLFSTPMSVDRMGITSAYVCVVGTGWDGYTEKDQEATGTTTMNTTIASSLPRDCPASARKVLSLRSVVTEERSKDTTSFFLSGDIFTTTDLQSARGSRALFVVKGEGGTVRLYLDLGADMWTGGIINAYEGPINLPDEGKDDDDDGSEEGDGDDSDGDDNNGDNPGGNPGGDDSGNVDGEEESEETKTPPTDGIEGNRFFGALIQVFAVLVVALFV